MIGFLVFFIDVLDLFWTFWKILYFFCIFFGTLCFCVFFSFSFSLKSYNWLQLTVKKVTTAHQKWPKLGQFSIKSPFFAQRANQVLAKARVGPSSGGPQRFRAQVDPILGFSKIAFFPSHFFSCLEQL